MRLAHPSGGWVSADVPTMLRVRTVAPCRLEDRTLAAEGGVACRPDAREAEPCASPCLSERRSQDTGVLDDFVASNREAIIARARKRVASRALPKASEAELTNGIPMFLDQLGQALRRARSSSAIDHEEIAKSAARHGRDLLRVGLTIGQVVRDYGDVCQAITELAVEQRATISAP